MEYDDHHASGSFDTGIGCYNGNDCAENTAGKIADRGCDFLDFAGHASGSFQHFSKGSRRSGQSVWSVFHSKFLIPLHDFFAADQAVYYDNPDFATGDESQRAGPADGIRRTFAERGQR